MSAATSTQVEVTCLPNRTIRPVRFLWESERLTISDWDTRRATPNAWEGEVRTLKGRTFRMTYSQAQSRWYVEKLEE
jgi:hypothetical protein